MKTAYQEFLDILKEFRTLSASALGVGAAVPFFAYVAKIAPPWPPGIMLLTALTELVSLVVVFQFLRMQERGVVNRAIAIIAPLLFIISFCYLLFVSMFTFVTPHTSERFPKGFVCRAEIQRLYPDECPWLGLQIIRESQYNAENLWTDWSIALMQVTIASFWMASFVLLSSLIGAFLVFQTKTKGIMPDQQA